MKLVRSQNFQKLFNLKNNDNSAVPCVTLNTTPPKVYTNVSYYIFYSSINSMSIIVTVHGKIFSKNIFYVDIDYFIVIKSRVLSRA